jgi:hypothetical protein
MGFALTLKVVGATFGYLGGGGKGKRAAVRR